MNKIKISLPKELSFLIVGSGDPVKTFLKQTKEIYPKCSVYILSDEECDKSWSVRETKPIDEVAKELNYEIEFIKDINSESVLERIKEHECNICFVIGSRWILKKPIVKYFKGSIFNYHTSDLPDYRGGGGYRWQVMNNVNSIYIAFHQLTEEIDSGPILKVYRKKISNQDFYPKVIFDELYEFTKEKFGEFLKFISNDSHELDIQSENSGTYFPLLDNDMNGAIDLTWGKDDIKTFVHAFSYPYKGAYLYYRDKKYFFKETDISLNKNTYHPFAIGLIVNITEQYLDFIVQDGVLCVSKITDENGTEVNTDVFHLGDRFYIPYEELLKAKLYRPSNKDFVLKTN